MDDKQPFVSVIIPAYNCADYIGEAIDSVLEQSYPNREIIVIDDGSNDDTQAKLTNYQDKIKYIYRKRQGVSAARNHGLEIARGSLVVFLDADDKFLPGKLEMQTHLFVENPSIDIVSSGLRLIDESGHMISDLNWWKYFPELDARVLIIYKLIFLGAMLIKKDALLKIGGFNTSYQVAQDIDLIFRMVQHGVKAEWLQQITVCYRQRRESTTNKNFLNAAQKAHHVITDFFSQKDLQESLSSMKNESIYDHLVWCAWQFYMRNQEKYMSEFLDKSLQYCTISKWRLEDVWLSKFEHMTQTYGREFNKKSLQAGKNWQKLMKKISKRLPY